MAITRRQLSRLRREFSDPEAIRKQPFELLQRLVALRGEKPSSSALVQELILRALEHRDAFGGASRILDALVREVGLFPYLEDRSLSMADELAREAHRSTDLDKVVFHHPQAKIFHALMAGKSVVLSAPTSFGKSLIIDAIVARRRFRNIFIVVPTLALIDETRRRLSKFRDHYKIVTHGSQLPGESNVFVLTQERVLQNKHLPSVDFFVVDEFYKLSPGEGDDDKERCALLNVAFYRLLKHCKHFYLLGPHVRGLTASPPDSVSFDFIKEDYQTVVSEVHRLAPSPSALEALSALAVGLKDPTLVFCSSPGKTSDVADALPSSERIDSELNLAADWIAQNYHEEWHFVTALRRGIGVHHGKLPRALGQYVVRAFDEGKLRFLVCTSTLIEGVNTRAKNIVVYDHKINRKPLDLFTFRNICGRSGRMFRHFVGHVYLFHDAPLGQLPLVDIPAISPGSDTATQLLVQLDYEGLEQGARSSREQFVSQDVLPFEVLKRNVGVIPEQQLAFARALRADPVAFSEVLAWTGIPNWTQLFGTAKLIWTHFGGASLAGGSVVSSSQLATLMMKLAQRKPIHSMIAEQAKFFNGDVEKAVRSVLDFQRLWATFHLPRFLRTIGDIQDVILSELGLAHGDFEPYAAMVECLFLDPAVVALEEYGIPLPLGRKLLETGVLRPDSDLDGTLVQLRMLDDEGIGLFGPFEQLLLRDAIKFA